MGFKFKFIGKTKLDGNESEMYQLNNTGICVTRGDYSQELNKKIEKPSYVIWVSFSHKSRKALIPQMDIDYALKRFGIDVSKHYYTWVQNSKNPANPKETMDIMYFEQIQDGK